MASVTFIGKGPEPERRNETVWYTGKTIAVITKGRFTTDDPELQSQLRSLGYQELQPSGLPEPTPVKADTPAAAPRPAPEAPPAPKAPVAPPAPAGAGKGKPETKKAGKGKRGKK